MAVKADAKVKVKREELRKLREKIGSRDFVSEKLGISKVYLRMIETGSLTPGRDLLIKFGAYFDRPLEVLFPDLFNNQVS